MNVDACTSLPITTAMSRLDLGIGVSLPGPLRRAGLPRPEPAAGGTGRGGAGAAAWISLRGRSGSVRRTSSGQPES
jgi:hypothetical protein